jgi:transcription initiation factor TFIIE subunit alpha
MGLKIEAKMAEKEGKTRKKKAEGKGKENGLKKIMYEIADYLAGEEGKKIIDVIYGKKAVSEFLIAKKTGFTVHQTRNLLYKLASRNVVNSARKKAKKRGWFTTYYSLDIIKGLEEYKKLNLKKLQEIEGEIKSKQTTNLYSCPNGCITMKEEKALLHEFFCPDCGELMQLLNMENEIKKLNAERERILRDIKRVEEILALQKERIEKKRVKKMEKERAEKRRERKERREKEKKKAEKGGEKIKGGGKIERKITKAAKTKGKAGARAKAVAKKARKKR